MGERDTDGGDGFVGRMEVVSGRTGRRIWTDDVKGRIVRESFRPGAGVHDVARRHGVAPQQLTQWRRAARDGRLCHWALRSRGLFREGHASVRDRCDDRHMMRSA